LPDKGSQQPENNATDRILDFIKENPSCHLRKIKKELNLAMGTVQYHLDRLEKAGRITSQRHGLINIILLQGLKKMKNCCLKF
jgi:predicted transcriptional regulator